MGSVMVYGVPGCDRIPSISGQIVDSAMKLRCHHYCWSGVF